MATLQVKGATEAIVEIQLYDDIDLTVEQVITMIRNRKIVVSYADCDLHDEEGNLIGRVRVAPESDEISEVEVTVLEAA